MKLEKLTSYLDELLDSSSFKDYGPNGLQIEGRKEINTIITGVSSCVDLFEAAAAKKADAVIVHHGIFWDGQNAVITKSRKDRIRPLILNDISLFAYHLPLDAHPEFGNNAGLADVLNLKNLKPFADFKGKSIGFMGEFSESLSSGDAKNLIQKKINPDARFYDFGPQQIRTAAVCSGGAQSALNEAIEKGADLYITGEESEWVYHLAKEERIHFVSAGHHATERFGVQLLGEHLADQFNLNVEFVDVFNPI
ncbi:MAG: Nif3-like dinuclear metal center hexameric protein [Spirochaetia bacterium]|nr:Nif3-like dinuclear metal center hexameric protein [Spirochaetia bacterium]